MSGLCETVYCNKIKVRESYRVTVDSETANTATHLITDNFPEYVDCIHNHDDPSIFPNSISVVESYREPYNDHHVALYCFKQCPNEVLEQFRAERDLPLRPWYGYKFNINTGKVFLKLSFDDDGRFEKPNFGQTPIHYAAIYSEEGFTGHRDAYLQWNMAARFPNTDDEIITSIECAEYCEENDMTFPIPNYSGSYMHLWSVAYNADTLAPSIVKAYSFIGDD